MPYGGTTPDEDARIERCVEKVMAEGKDKSSAIAICKSQIRGSRRGAKNSTRRRGNR